MQCFRLNVLEQVMSFEYLFDKLEHQKAQDKRFSLKKELTYCLNLFPELLTNARLSVDDISEEIKETRRTIAHGYAYFYNFKDDSKMKYLILLLDRLIRNMSLLWIGFSKEDIRLAHWILFLKNPLQKASPICRPMFHKLFLILLSSHCHFLQLKQVCYPEISNGLLFRPTD